MIKNLYLKELYTLYLFSGQPRPQIASMIAKWVQMQKLVLWVRTKNTVNSHPKTKKHEFEMMKLGGASNIVD
jgi:hypothetical protein